MPLSFRITKRVELPDGEWIEVRMPSLAILDKAKQATTRQSFETMSAAGGIDPAMFQGLRSAATGVIERTVRDEYDWHTLLSACVVSWSYEDPVTPENVAELLPEVVDLLLATLFARESAEERKKGSAASTKR